MMQFTSQEMLGIASCQLEVRLLLAGEWDMTMASLMKTGLRDKVKISFF